MYAIFNNMKTGLRWIVGCWGIVVIIASAPCLWAEDSTHGNTASPFSQTQASDASPQDPSSSPQIAVTPDSPEGTIPPEIAEIVQQIPSLEELSRYTLGINDRIEIMVLRHPEASGQYVINSEGTIQYEFVGDVKVVELTKEEVRKLIAGKLSTYIVSPDVTVKILEYNSKVVYVIGEVGNPGKIFMRGDTITVREALLEAGLPLLSAAGKRSRLITPSKDGKAELKIVNVEALLYEGDLREDLAMKPGDTLYIPATVLSKAMRMISPVTQPVGTAAGTTRTVYPGF